MLAVDGRRRLAGAAALRGRAPVSRSPRARPDGASSCAAGSSRDEAGRPAVEKFPRDGSGLITSLREADGLIEIARGCYGRPARRAGDVPAVLRLRAELRSLRKSRPRPGTAGFASRREMAADWPQSRPRRASSGARTASGLETKAAGRHNAYLIRLAAAAAIARHRRRGWRRRRTGRPSASAWTRPIRRSSSLDPSGADRRLRQGYRRRALRADEGEVRIRQPGLGRHHPGAARQQIRRHPLLDVDHRGAQAADRLHRQDTTTRRRPSPCRRTSTLTGVTPEDLAGITIGAQTSTTHANYAEEKFPDAELKIYPSPDEYKLDLANGRLDAAIDDVVVLDEWVKSEAGACCRILGTLTPIPVINGAGAGIGIRKEDTDLRDMFNKAIAGNPRRRHLQEDQRQVFPVRRLRQLNAPDRLSEPAAGASLPPFSLWRRLTHG